MISINKELSLSTSCCASRYKSGAKMVEDIIDMGFKQIELNYLVTMEMIEEIIPYVEKGNISISSVHHPLPKARDELYGVESIMLGFQDEDSRNQAIDITKNTIDICERLGGKAVVIHPTQVQINESKDFDKLLSDMYKQGKKNTWEYKLLFEEMMEYRQKNSYKPLLKTLQSLEQLSDYIEHKNYSIKLGIENRAHCHQIPDFYETEFLLEQLGGGPVGFWYDIGHGIMMENLGMFDNIKELSKIRHKVIGMHIHDAYGMNDHMPPYYSSKYLDNFIELIKETPIKVLEISDKYIKESVIKGCEELSKKL